MSEGGGVSRQTTDGDVIFSKTSSINAGKVEVREFKDMGPTVTSALRTLWFENSPRVWQSAVRFEQGKPDFSDLPFHSSRALAFATGLAQKGADSNVMLIGLGGGTLAGFLLEQTALKSLSVVEIDPVVCEAASLFGLEETHPRLSLSQGCGLEAVTEAAPGSLNCVILDAGTAAGDDGGIYAPAAVFRTPEAAAAMAAALSPGGVLAVTVAGGDAEDVLDVVSLFEGAMPAGSAVVILENRDASHAWLRTPPSQVVLCLTPAADGAATPAASRLGMVERASRFEEAVPAATAFDLPRRIRREWSDAQGLRFRVSQLKTFARNHVAVPGLAEVAGTGSKANETQLEVLAPTVG